MKKDFKESNIKAKIIREAFNTWMCCWSQGVGELESVSQGRFKRFQFRAGSRNRDSVPAKDWPCTEFATKSAGCTTFSDSSSLFHFFFRHFLIKIGRRVRS
jgi:hypothetical protein